VRIQDNTLRDGHQSLCATRMRTEDMIPVAEQMDDLNFWAMEIWGGATFDAMHRFLAEDPWDRPRRLKNYIKKTPMSMLLRGQNLVGYRQYPDDVVRAFIDKACEVGIDVFRVFDALNDLRNIETCAERIKSNGKHFQGAVCYSLTRRRLGGEVYNITYFVSKCAALQDLGADSICIKDMSGILSPYDAYDLVVALKQRITVPLHLHTHYTSGMASMTCLKAIEAGVDIVDTCLAPFAMRTSMPAIEPLVVALQGTARDTGIDLGRLTELGGYFEKVAAKYIDFFPRNGVSAIDHNVLVHQIPGGMISNLINQLREMDALDRLADIYNEVPITRRELGNPPLVTPISQIIGAQAFMNVLFGRYKRVTNQLRDLAYGLYGRTPAEIDPEIRKKILKGYKRGDVPIGGRPADYLEPELEEARQRIGRLAKTEEDLLTYALYPKTGEQYLKWKYGIEPIPDNLR
jgi:pyruvate carboxylase subunit B